MLFTIMAVVGTGMMITGGAMEHQDKKTENKKEEISKMSPQEQVDELAKLNGLDKEQVDQIKDLLKKAGIE